MGDAVELNIADKLIVPPPDIEIIDVREIEAEIDGEPVIVAEAIIDCDIREVRVIDNVILAEGVSLLDTVI